MGLDWCRPGETLAPAFARAFSKAQLGGGVVLPASGAVFVSVKDADKPWIVEPVRLLQTHGFRILATGGTASYLAEQGLTVEPVKKVLEGRPHIVDSMKNGGVQLVFNTTEGRQSLADSFEIRRTALMMKTPYFTTAAGALAAAQAIVEGSPSALEVRPLQSYA
jgi:carbamoyl-phosphate synthase large subunit